MLLSFLSISINCSASALAWGFLGVLHSCLKPRYLLKFGMSCPLNGGPLSLLITVGIPSGDNVQSSFGITAWVLVLLTNSTSAHCECLHNFDD